jgi:hypothetical protein
MSIFVARRLLQLGALGHGANLELGAVLLENALIVVFPEGLGRVLAAEALEDLGAARVLLKELCREKRGLVSRSALRTACAKKLWSAGRSWGVGMPQAARTLTRHIIDVVLDDDPDAAGLVLVRTDVGDRVLLRHVERRF